MNTPISWGIVILSHGGVPEPVEATAAEINANSVRDHITAIFNKLGASNRAEAVAPPSGSTC